MQSRDPDDSPAEEDALDTLFSALADGDRRRVVRYFQSSRDDTATVEDLVDDAATRVAEDRDRERIALTYHHVTLPALVDAGVVEYDARSNAVRYRGDRLLEQCLRLADGQPVET